MTACIYWLRFGYVPNYLGTYLGTLVFKLNSTSYDMVSTVFPRIEQRETVIMRQKAT